MSGKEPVERFDGGESGRRMAVVVGKVTSDTMSGRVIGGEAGDGGGGFCGFFALMEEKRPAENEQLVVERGFGEIDAFEAVCFLLG